MTKNTVARVKTLLRKMNQSKLRIAAERDKLRDLVSEFQDIEQSCEDAVQELESAADRLSELL